MRNSAGTCKGICRYNLVYDFLKQLLPLQSSVFVVQFSNAFWHGNKAFPKAVLRMKLFLLVIFHLPQSKYRNAKTCFYSCRYQNQNFPLASHSCGSCSTRVTLTSHSCHTHVAFVSLVSHSCSYRIRVALVSLVSGTRIVNQTISWFDSQCFLHTNMENLILIPRYSSN